MVDKPLKMEAMKKKTWEKSNFSFSFSENSGMNCSEVH